MNINFTKIYRLWFLLTSISVLGVLITFFMGYDSIQHVWKSSFHNIHTLFIGILLAAVFVRIYMALNKINAVPLMHLFNANNILDKIIALAYISMCTVLLLTLATELYLLVVSTAHQILFIHRLRDAIQPVFAIMVLIHVLYVLYVNVVQKSGSLKKLIQASTILNK